MRPLASPGWTSSKIMPSGVARDTVTSALNANTPGVKATERRALPGPLARESRSRLASKENLKSEGENELQSGISNRLSAINKCLLQPCLFSHEGTWWENIEEKEKEFLFFHRRSTNSAYTVCCAQNLTSLPTNMPARGASYFVSGAVPLILSLSYSHTWCVIEFHAMQPN